MKKQIRQSYLALGVSITATTLLLSGCAGSDTVGEPLGDPISGGTLTYATGEVEPSCLDPVVSGNVSQALVSTQYLESLFFQDDNGEIQPWLAKSWKWSDDRLSLEVTLRDDVTFTDGAPLNASTITANVAHIKDPATRSSTARLAIEKVTSVDELDSHTARINLSEPDNALLEQFSQAWVPIESQAALSRGVDENCLAPVGTGPFKVDSWQKQQQITLTRNENYNTAPPNSDHTGVAYLDKIVWRFLPDDTARFAALQSGEVDVIDVIQPQDVVAAQSDPSLKTLIGSRPGQVVNLTFNTTRAPFDDVKVREAFVRSVDVDAALTSIFLGTVPRTNSMLSSVTKFSRQDPQGFATDVDHANQLLDEAGWTQRDSDGYRIKDGNRLSAKVVQASIVLIPVPILEQFQASAKNVGIELNISQVEPAAFWTTLSAWDYDLAPLYYSKNSPAVLNLTNDSSHVDPVFAGGFHSNSNGLKSEESVELDTVLRAAAVTANETERGQLYDKAQQIINSQYLHLPIYDQQTRLGFRSDLAGVRFISPLSMPTFYDTWLDRS
ncbi:oligopeptide ABC transporter substrate-binding protein [Rhodococcus erythropolis]|uniref:Oligopeptide ABC transporter substrate-binding protein n=1 Tax=Rhodococcus erythropolis TaxID=1833 RepID=A0A0C3ABR4_RHOER|nr:oligopeptide ABC transporter substrate-binding protein [Rhodococcus erythropolis]KIM17514.1 oligopeptide ABC transporter substrate-binding protein [Rhodococcus erythropolis]